MLALSLCLGLAFGAPVVLADDRHGGGVHPHVQMQGVSDIVRDPTDLPPPIAKRGPEHVRIDLETVEVTGHREFPRSLGPWLIDLITRHDLDYRSHLLDRQGR